MATSTDGTATPTPAHKSPEQHSDGDNGKQTVLDSLTNTLSKLELDFLSLNASNSANANGLAQMEYDEIDGKAHQLRAEVGDYDKSHKHRIDEIKTRIREAYPTEVAEQLRPVIQSHIQAEVQACTKDEVKKQYEKLMPISLEQQLGDMDKQLSMVKTALNNSEARSFNSSVDIVDSVTRKDQLKPLLKPDGTQSKLWPLDLNSFFAYDAETVKKLLKDYNIPVDKTHDANLNSFLGYIGVRQQVV
ncbi:hypothetical protein FB446DRAFT_837124 [Lentinula raphanica]|nr:hypothetical protein FB446DRAFT_837124 [Lentinula raphanica]